jgi:hypothetical protein
MPDNSSAIPARVERYDFAQADSASDILLQDEDKAPVPPVGSFLLIGTCLIGTALRE